MDWLNYHHLHYFWVVAREGSLSAGAQKLRLAPSTVSAQLRALEASLGHRLFERAGRGLQLTAWGRVTLQYADEIFALGRELFEAVRDEAGHPLRLRVGVASLLPRFLAWRLLAPATHLPFPVHLVCRSDRPEALVAELALHHLDLVLSDAPAPLNREVNATSRLLLASRVTLMAAPALAGPARAQFPAGLDGAPMLLPATGSALRRALEGWFEDHGLAPRVVAEFDDSALLKAFGREGAGLVPVAEAAVADVAAAYGLEPVGALDGVEERVYAVALPGKVEHAGLLAILEASRAERAGSGSLS